MIDPPQKWFPLWVNSDTCHGKCLISTSSPPTILSSRSVEFKFMDSPGNKKKNTGFCRIWNMDKERKGVSFNYLMWNIPRGKQIYIDRTFFDRFLVYRQVIENDQLLFIYESSKIIVFIVRNIFFFCEIDTEMNNNWHIA